MSTPQTLRAEVKKAETPFFDSLSDQQKAFVLAYVECFNRTKAAIRAGYSPDSARCQGSRLYTDADINAAISELLPLVGITKDRIRSEVAEIAFDTDVADFEQVFAGDKLSELRNAGIPTHRIKRIKATRRVVGSGEDAYQVEDVTLELHDKVEALKELARIEGMITERRELSGNLNLRDLSQCDEAELRKLSHAVDTEHNPANGADPATGAVGTGQA